MKLAPSISRLIESFEKLPGIGPKTAQRLVFYMLHTPDSYIDGFVQSLQNLKKNTKKCSVCFNMTETDPCPICSDQNRDKTQICLVERPLDILAFERGGFYKGVYHVLHGVIDPLNNILPDQLFIPQLVNRLKYDKITELIIATNPTTEGESTAMYIQRLLERQNINNFKITRLGRGLPTGADIEYADQQTLAKSFEGRRSY